MRFLQRPTRTLTLALLAFSPGVAMSANPEGEEVPAEEALAIRQVTELISAEVSAAAEKSGRAFRDAHRKQHGCVKAQFVVESDLSPTLKQGLFAQPATYSAVIRYSNGSGDAQDDHQGDGRGMAVKVLGVKGERNLNESDDETSSQDFLMINHNVFFVRNAADYVDFQLAVTSGNLVWWLLNPRHVFHETLIAKAIQGKKMVNPLDSTYFSMTASKLGDTQMKFRAIPCANSEFVSSSDSADRFRENLEATLAAGPACFLFQVQNRVKPAVMPVEDPTIEWSEKIAPFTTVAKIIIPAQKPAQGEDCEALSFNPWNGLAEHRPLGGISRARKAVYQTISRLRHDFNKQRREEPAN